MHSDSTSSGVLVVDLDALARNYRRLANASRPAECAAVVKADAYGLGMGPVAKRLRSEGCRQFFVATAAEGVELRQQLPDATIHVLDGALSDTVELLVRSDLCPVLNSLQQLELWQPLARPALLHVDTGMSRLGMCMDEVDVLRRDPSRLRGLRIDCLMTHLACADQPEHPLNREQLDRFARLRELLPGVPVSIGNSAGLFAAGDSRGDLVRPGIALYGGNPFVDHGDLPVTLDAVVNLRGRILQLREVVAPVTVGYGATHQAMPPARLAVVGVGYADGYRRSLGNRAHACVAGMRVPVVGRVSMDYLCVDVTALPAGAVHCGDHVDLIGNGVSLEELAQAAGTINYEILTGLGHRLQRVYKGNH